MRSKKKKQAWFVSGVILISTYILFWGILLIIYNYNIIDVSNEIAMKSPSDIPVEDKIISYEASRDGVVAVNQRVTVYDNLTFEELAAKLDESLGSTLSGTGSIFAKASLDYGVDPYLAVAIALHETGCKWTCSSLVTDCNNVGGVKGTPSCDGGSYRAYSTLEEGITKYISNIKYNYVDYGLTDAVSMEKKYAGSTTWAAKVNNYIDSIKNN